MQRIVRHIVVVLLAGFSALAGAQPYPSRAVRIIVPTPVGGPGDIVARGAAQFLSQSLGQPFIVENRLGVGNIVGADACAKATPDGYTLCNVDSFTITLNPFTYAKLPYDPRRDLSPIMLYGFLMSSLSVHPSVPAKSFAELIELAKAKPNALAWGSAGPSSSSHFYIEWLRSTRAAHFLEVPFKAPSESMQRMLAGDTQVSSFSLGQSLALHKAGKIRIIAIPGETRSALLPEIQSFKEAGMELSMNTWFGTFAPSGTPAAILQRLHGELSKVVATPAFKDKFLTTQGIETPAPAGGTPDSFAAYIRDETEMYGKLVRTVGVKPQE
jgi:tripartite-type tricarboxylate transporter receptor subunit TctC